MCCILQYHLALQNTIVISVLILDLFFNIEIWQFTSNLWCFDKILMTLQNLELCTSIPRNKYSFHITYLFECCENRKMIIRKIVHCFSTHPSFQLSWRISICVWKLSTYGLKYGTSKSCKTHFNLKTFILSELKGCACSKKKKNTLYLLFRKSEV